jgi:hypothetical protein
MKIRVGDLITHEWTSILSFHGLVVNVAESTELQKRQGILYTFELLQTDGRKFTYDVFRNGATPTILSRCKTSRKNGKIEP